MRYAFLGAVLMVGGIAAQIEAARHHPLAAGGTPDPFSTAPTIPPGWSPTAYDLVRIGGWALLIFGAVIIAFALAREFRPASR